MYCTKIFAKTADAMDNANALGKLNDFSQVFDVPYFEEHKEEYLHWLFKRYQMNDTFIKQFYSYYSDYPQMKHYRETDMVWSNISMAEGLYDDGWVKPCLTAQSTADVQGIMKVSLYLADTIKEGWVEIHVNGMPAKKEMLVHEMNKIVVNVPKEQLFTWGLKFSEFINPKRDGTGEDVRDLSAIITRIELI